MIIGTVRPEEARVFDSQAGFHPYINERGEEYGGFEVFWDDEDRMHDSGPRNFDEDGEPVQPGWYWWACMPGCLPDGEAHGPFSTSSRAYNDALGD